MKQNAKIYVPLVKQNVMKLEVFILGGQRIDQKRRRDGGEGEERGLRKGAESNREKRDKRELKRRIRNIDTCLCLLFSFLKALRFS